MSNESQSDQAHDPHRERSQMRLECIGSFKAYTQDDEAYTIEIWTHFGAVHDRERQRLTPTTLVLTTTAGYGVDRIAQGAYRLTDNPEISLSTDDPRAP